MHRSSDRHKHSSSDDDSPPPSRGGDRERDRSDSKRRYRHSSRQHRSQRHSAKDGEDAPRTRQSRSRSPLEPRGSGPKGYDSPEVNSGGAAQESLSIEETNKLRAQLGLAPLELNSGSGGGGGESETSYSKREDVHVPAVNYGSQRRSEKLKEKLQAQKEKRSLVDKLSKTTKGLGEEDPDVDSMENWLRRSRKLEEEKKAAEKRAQMLDEMDKELGIGELLQREKVIAKEKASRYDSEHLEGLVVEHDATKFKEGSTVILTLKDRGVLEEGEDGLPEVLVNVNMVDDERVAKSLENKRVAALGWERAHLLEEEDQVEAAMKPRGVLDKYNAEIEGDQRKNFTLTGRGAYHGDHERMIQQLRADMAAGAISLATSEPKIASDFFTEEELQRQVGFKRRKRRAGNKAAIRRITADDLLAMPQVDEDPLELGRETMTKAPSTSSAETSKKNGIEIRVDNKVDLRFPELKETRAIDSDDEDLRRITLEPDEAQEELSRALNQVRKLKQRQVPDVTEELSHLLNTNSKEEPTVPGVSSETLVLNSTREYCRKIGTTLKDFSGDILLSTMPTMVKEEPLASSSSQNYHGHSSEDEERNHMEMDDDEEETPSRPRTSGWQEVDGESAEGNVAAMDFSERPKARQSVSKQPSRNSKEELKGVLHDEPVLNQGIMCAVQLASKRGYLEKKDSQNSTPSTTSQMLTAKNFVREDIRYDDIDAKFAKRGGAGRFQGGAVTEFRDKEDYKPDVRLEYLDSMGRKLNEKEAFRVLSHRFHGKGSGKNKTDKRMRKVEEEMAMAHMSSSDTPLGSAEKLHRKLQSEGTPYVVLSGKNANVKKLSK